MSRCMKKMSALVQTLALAGLTCLVVGAAQAAEVRLRILETTDLHMNLLSYDYYQDKGTDQYGLDRTISLIKAARAEAPNSLLLIKQLLFCKFRELILGCCAYAPNQGFMFR